MSSRWVTIPASGNLSLQIAVPTKIYIFPTTNGASTVQLNINGGSTISMSSGVYAPPFIPLVPGDNISISATNVTGIFINEGEY